MRRIAMVSSDSAPSRADDALRVADQMNSPSANRIFSPDVTFNTIELFSGLFHGIWRWSWMLRIPSSLTAFTFTETSGLGSTSAVLVAALVNVAPSVVLRDGVDVSVGASVGVWGCECVVMDTVSDSEASSVADSEVECVLSLISSTVGLVSEMLLTCELAPWRA